VLDLTLGRPGMFEITIDVLPVADSGTFDVSTNPELASPGVFAVLPEISPGAVVCIGCTFSNTSVSGHVEAGTGTLLLEGNGFFASATFTLRFTPDP
jgi:hypothetical protein